MTKIEAAVIASEAKQSTARTTVAMDCFVAALLAMTAEGERAEPVIGPRFARTRWHRPGMTA
jgi:hypothetical protein